MPNLYKFTVFSDMLHDFHVEAEKSDLIIDSLTIIEELTTVTVHLATPADFSELKAVLLRAFGPAFTPSLEEI